ncbi:hypothetical protein NE236_42235 [Actinoallomurus purpureus]|uniref:hypothetical protein n=1 Tax=Actinoallomurus purpureus TaxID=478114 RepID=UPI0020934A4D|nr:hypothetical protein [Actinoallomurus purpureus]MCO6011590.1 hypothetical protein [Actinoallomurus purpureus]
MTRSVRVFGVAGAMAALLLSGACSGDKPKAAAAESGKVVTTQIVLLKKYDAASGALEYQGTKKVQEPDEAIEPTGPVQTATVAKNATVLSAVNICSGEDATVDEKTGVGTKPCTLQQLETAIKGGDQVDAYLTMKGRTVTKVAEAYHP